MLVYSRAFLKIGCLEAMKSGGVATYRFNVPSLLVSLPYFLEQITVFKAYFVHSWGSGAVLEDILEPLVNTRLYHLVIALKVDYIITLPLFIRFALSVARCLIC